MSEELAVTIADTAIKITPPALVSSMTFLGVSLPFIVQVLTVVYLLVVTAYTINKWRVERKERKHGRRSQTK